MKELKNITMNRLEKEQQDSQRFVNLYKGKTYQEIFETLIARNSRNEVLYKDEHTLLHLLKDGNKSTRVDSVLLGYEMVLKKLLDSNSSPLMELREELNSIQDIMKNR